MDPNVSFAKQIEHNVAPVVLLSTFLVRPEYVDDFLSGFQKQFAIMRKQPGLISAQLHRGIAGSCLFMNYIIWETTDAFKQRVALLGMCLGELVPSPWILRVEMAASQARAAIAAATQLSSTHTLPIRDTPMLLRASGLR